MREEVRFRSGDDECAAWLYPPAHARERAACVILAHGFAGVREARLDAYAERFAAAGHAALVFDYRHHGASSGEPRLLIEVARQQDDWRAAIAFARACDAIDPDAIVLWGTSYAGGHVVEVAARDHGIAAVIAQTPHADGIATLRAIRFRDRGRLAAAALRDLIGSRLGRRARLIPVVGPPGTLAAMTSPGAEAGYLALLPPHSDWPNRFIARAPLELPLFRPVRSARRVRAPLLVQVMTGDLVTPPEPARRMARMAPRGELIEYPGDHFDVYVGEPFERAVADQLGFLDRALR